MTPTYDLNNQDYRDHVVKLLRRFGKFRKLKSLNMLSLAGAHVFDLDGGIERQSNGFLKELTIPERDPESFNKITSRLSKAEKKWAVCDCEKLIHLISGSCKHTQVNVMKGELEHTLTTITNPNTIDVAVLDQYGNFDSIKDSIRLLFKRGLLTDGAVVSITHGIKRAGCATRTEAQMSAKCNGYEIDSDNKDFVYQYSGQGLGTIMQVDTFQVRKVA